MAESIEILEGKIRALIEPGANGRLLARGMARGMIWADGVLPEGAPKFTPQLSNDLLNYGYTLLARILRLAEELPQGGELDDAYRVAAECLESSCRNGPSDDPMRGFHLVIAAAAFHLGHYSARSYCLLPAPSGGLNLSTTESILLFLLRHRLADLRNTTFGWLSDEDNLDEGLVAKLGEDDAQVSSEDGVDHVLTHNFLSAMAMLEYALATGRQETLDMAIDRLEQGSNAAMSMNRVPQFWTNKLSQLIVHDIWEHSLHSLLPTLNQGEYAQSWNALRRKYIAQMTIRDNAEIEVWPSQWSATQRAVDTNDSLVVALPTSAGKTKIAELCILRTLAESRRIIYVTPLRALSAQVERVLSKTFSRLGFSVSSLYGASGVTVADVGSLRASDIVVATPEKLDFAIRLDADVLNEIGLIVLDEGHMIGLGTREIRYEVLVQRLLRRDDAATRRIVCLSAVFSTGEAFDDLTSWIRNDVQGDAITSSWRPTRLRHGKLVWAERQATLTISVDGEKPFVPRFVEIRDPIPPRRNSFPHEDSELVVGAAERLVSDGHRVLIYCPLKKSVEALGKSFVKLESRGYFQSTDLEEDQLRRALWAGAEWLGENHIALQALRLGIALHHGSLPRPFLREIESLLDKKVIPITIASPTLAQGLDLSCSALLIRSIYRGGSVIPPEEFANVAGRAGRAFVDLDGLVIYPIHAAPMARRRKERAFDKLIQASQSRELESGIVLLISKIIELLVRRFGFEHEDLVNYVLNYGGDWAHGEEIDHEDDEDEQLKELLELLEDFDTTILTTVVDLSVPADALAEALDEALRSSFWRRRLARLDDDDQDIQRILLEGRARWIWAKTDDAQRRSFFASGVGVQSGTAIDGALPEILPVLFEAETSLEEGNIGLAIERICDVADFIFDVRQFQPHYIDENWRDLLAGWVRGDAMGPLVADDPSRSIAFIQSDVVFNFVWGIEAIRVQAIAKNFDGADGVGGRSALALTHGVPTKQAAMILQAGLPSRVLAMRLLEEVPGDFNDSAGLTDWAYLVDFMLDGLEDLDDEVAVQVWRDFVESREPGDESMWQESASVHTVNWDDGVDGVAEGISVRILNDNFESRIYTSDMRRLGVLQQYQYLADQGLSSGRIDADLNVAATYYHPAE